MLAFFIDQRLRDSLDRKTFDHWTFDKKDLRRTELQLNSYSLFIVHHSLDQRLIVPALVAIKVQGLMIKV